MKNLIAFLAFIMMAQAQAQVPAAQVQVVQAAPQAAPIVAQAPAQAPKKTLIYDERTNQLVEVAPQVQAQAAQPQPVVEAQSGGQPIYILNNQKLQGYQGAVQDAPTQVVQDAPAKVSASETIRKERQGAEAATEDGIVQTLEKARLDDEVRRREKFNNALNSTTSATTSAATSSAAAVAAPAAAAPAAATAQSASAVSNVNAQGAQGPVITTTTATTEENEVVEVPAQKPQAKKRKKVILEDETSQDSKEDVHQEVRAAIAEERHDNLNQTQYYISGLVGAAGYSTANIRSNLASGFSVGVVTPDRFVFEGSFIYSKNEIDNIAGAYANGLTYDFSQYNFSAAAKYQFLPGKLRPAVGGVVAYTHRSYSLGDGYGGGYGYGYNNNDNSLGTTDAFDGGVDASLDLMLTNNFSIGADFRYLWNIATKDAGANSYRTGYNGSYQYYMNNGVPDVEDMGYYIATLSAKFTF